MSEQSWHLGQGLRQQVRLELNAARRVTAFNVPLLARRVLRDVMGIAAKLFPQVTQWPKILPVSTVQRKSAYVNLGTDTVVVYDHEEVNCLVFLIKLHLQKERAVYTLSEFSIRAAEKFMADGDSERAFATVQAAHETLDADARRSSDHYPFLFRPQLPAESSLIQQINRLVAVFILAHEIGHFVADEPSCDGQFRESISTRYHELSIERDGESRENRFIRARLEYDISPEGASTKSAFKTSFLLDDVGWHKGSLVKRLVNRQERQIGEAFADSFATWVTSAYAIEHDVEPALVFETIWLIFENMAALEAFSWAIEHGPRKKPGRGHHVVFEPSESSIRWIVLMGLLQDVVKGLVKLSPECERFWIDDEQVSKAVLDAVRMKQVLSRFELFEITKRRVVMEVMSQENVTCSEELWDYLETLPEPLKNFTFQRLAHRLVNDEKIWKAEALYGVDYPYDQYERRFIGMIHAFRTVVEIVWDLSSAKQRHGCEYEQLGVNADCENSYDLIRRTRNDVIDRYCQFPPRKVWHPQFDTQMFKLLQDIQRPGYIDEADGD